MEATHLSVAFKRLHSQLNSLPSFSKEPILPVIASINRQVFKLLQLLPDTPASMLAKREAFEILQQNNFLPDVSSALDTPAAQKVFDLIINIQAAVEVLLDGDDAVWMDNFTGSIPE